MTTDKPRKYLFDEVLFFGRNLDEYVQMFDLDLEGLRGREILDCPGGPSPFAGEAEQHGISVVACDPMYGGTADELEALTLRQIEDVDRVQSQLVHLFDEPQGVAERKALRLVSLKKFIADFRRFENCGKKEERYRAESLPHLPFSDRQFDLVLSGNLLFLYAGESSGGMLTDSRFDFDFHLSAILELARVSKNDARIYPLNGPNDSNHPYLQCVVDALRQRGMVANVVPVPYRDIKDAHHMLQVLRATTNRSPQTIRQEAQPVSHR
jgi:hypothetical protein